MSNSVNNIQTASMSVASITGIVGAPSIIGHVVSNGVVSDVKVAGAVINRYDHVIVNMPPATRETLGAIIVGDHLSITEEGNLSVNVVNSVEQDNTNPIAASAVYMEIGNINALLNKI